MLAPAGRQVWRVLVVVMVSWLVMEWPQREPEDSPAIGDEPACALTREILLASPLTDISAADIFIASPCEHHSAGDPGPTFRRPLVSESDPLDPHPPH